jgi:predicted  nucleic acid-binding Zn-ribbon protein
MNSLDETLEQPTKSDAILQAIMELSKKIDDLEKRNNAQFEAIRQGIVDNNIRFDKLEGNFHLLRADVSTLVEEVRHNRKVLV